MAASAWRTTCLYDNLGLLAVPPQFGGTCDVNQSVNALVGCALPTAGFLAGGGLPAGTGSGLKTFAISLTQRAATANFLPPVQKLPYSETWNLGIEHVFGKKYTAEVRYVGTRGIHLPVQQQLNVQPKVTSSLFLPTFLTTPDPATIAGLTHNPGPDSGSAAHYSGVLSSWFHERHYLIPTLRPVHLPWIADTAHPQLQQQPADAGGVHMEPCFRQLHG